MHMTIDKRTTRERNPEKSARRKKVGDETPNPLPDEDIAAPQPPGDDSQANPEL